MSGNGRNATATVNKKKPLRGAMDTFTLPEMITWKLQTHYTVVFLEPGTTYQCGKTTDKNWRTLAYWGHEVNGQRWWLRLYRNELQMHFRNSVRRTYAKNLNDGLWHHVAAVNPSGGNSRNTVLLYIDGFEADFYGQWGQTSISTGSNYSFRSGKRWDNGQRLLVRLMMSVLFQGFFI